jgi:solute carrier family 35 protein F3/4
LYLSEFEVVVDVPWNYLCGSSALGVLFNFFINFGIAYTFPLFISLGTVMGIPVSALVDAFVRHVDLLNWKITGMDLIVGGFLLMLLPPSASVWVQSKLCFCTKFCSLKNNV